MGTEKDWNAIFKIRSQAYIDADTLESTALRISELLSESLAEDSLTTHSDIRGVIEDIMMAQSYAEDAVKRMEKSDE